VRVCDCSEVVQVIEHLLTMRSGPGMQTLACLVSRAVGQNLFDYAKVFGKETYETFSIEGGQAHGADYHAEGAFLHQPG